MHFSSHHIKVTCSLACWCWQWSPGWGVFVSCLHWKDTLLSPISILSSLEGSYHVQPTVKELGMGRCAPPPCRRMIYINDLQFCMRDLPLLPHLFIQSLIYITIVSWMFALYCGLQSNTSLFILLLTLLQLRPSGALSVGSCVPLAYHHQCGACLVLLFISPLTTRSSRLYKILALQDSPRSPPIFPAPALKSTSSVRNFCSFYWRVVLETKIWALGVFLATGPLQLIAKVVCVLISICTHTCKCFSV